MANLPCIYFVITVFLAFLLTFAMHLFFCVTTKCVCLCFACACSLSTVVFLGSSSPDFHSSTKTSIVINLHDVAANHAQSSKFEETLVWMLGLLLACSVFVLVFLFYCVLGIFVDITVQSLLPQFCMP